MLRKSFGVFVAAVAFATAVESRADDMPFAVVAAGDGFTNCLSRADARWTDGTVTVAIDGGATLKDGALSLDMAPIGVAIVKLER